VSSEGITGGVALASCTTNIDALCINDEDPGVQVVERYSHMIEGPTLSKCHVVEFGKFDLLSFRLA